MSDQDKEKKTKKKAEKADAAQKAEAAQSLADALSVFGAQMMEMFDKKLVQHTVVQDAKMVSRQVTSIDES